MKTVILSLLFGSMIWACNQSDTSGKPPVVPTTQPGPLEKSEPDPLRRQFKRFGFDVKTGKYRDYHGYQKDGC